MAVTTTSAPFVAANVTAARRAFIRTWRERLLAQRSLDAVALPSCRSYPSPRRWAALELALLVHGMRNV